MQLAHPKVAKLKPRAFRPQVCLCWKMSAEVKANSKLMPSALSLEQRSYYAVGCGKPMWMKIRHYLSIQSTFWIIWELTTTTIELQIVPKKVLGLKFGVHIIHESML